MMKIDEALVIGAGRDVSSSLASFQRLSTWLDCLTYLRVSCLQLIYCMHADVQTNQRDKSEKRELTLTRNSLRLERFIGYWPENWLAKAL